MASSTPQHPAAGDCADVTAAFAEHGLRCTKQRASILRELMAVESHPTADELFKLVKAELPGTSLATVYNTLELLCEHDLAVKLPPAGDESSARYDADLSPHLHARCRRTGKVYDIPAELSERMRNAMPPELIAELEAAMGVKIADLRLEVVAEPLE